MDPDEVLRQAEEHSSAISGTLDELDLSPDELAMGSPTVSELLEHARDLAQNLQDLSTWLEKGGMLPKKWQTWRNHGQH